jgi:hypothetical protein
MAAQDPMLSRPDEVELPPARSLAPLIVEALAHLGGEADRQDMIASALRIGNFTPEQRAVPSRATRTNATHRSELHHRLSWAISHAKNAGEIESLGRSRWRLVSADGPVG